MCLFTRLGGIYLAYFSPGSTLDIERYDHDYYVYVCDSSLVTVLQFSYILDQRSDWGYMGRIQLQSVKQTTKSGIIVVALAAHVGGAEHPAGCSCRATSHS